MDLDLVLEMWAKTLELLIEKATIKSYPIQVHGAYALLIICFFNLVLWLQPLGRRAGARGAGGDGGAGSSYPKPRLRIKQRYFLVKRRTDL